MKIHFDAALKIYCLLVLLGAVALVGSKFGKPDRAIHYSYTRCYGGEQSMANCSKVIAKRKNSNSPAAGVKCLPPTPIPNLFCNDKNVPLTGGNECTEGIFRLRQQNMLQYCYKGHWSVLCAFTHKEALVACYQMGYNTTSCKFICAMVMAIRYQ